MCSSLRILRYGVALYTTVPFSSIFSPVTSAKCFATDVHDLIWCTFKPVTIFCSKGHMVLQRKPYPCLSLWKLVAHGDLAPSRMTKWSSLDQKFQWLYSTEGMAPAYNVVLD